MSIIREVQAEFKSRGLMNLEELAPLLSVALGGHVLNLRQQGVKYDLGGDPDKWEIGEPQPLLGSGMDLRNNLMILGEPSTGKTVIGRQLFDERIGIVHGVLPGKMLGRTTDAALVGGKLTGRGGKQSWAEGLLARKRFHLLFSDEFSQVLDAGKSAHSAGMTNTLLKALNTGEVSSNLVGFDKEYLTYVTLIACTQPGRFEKVSGFDRRFLFHRNVPPHSDENTLKYKQAFFAYNEWEPSAEKIDALRQGFLSRFNDAQGLSSIRFTDELEGYVMDSPHIRIEMQETVMRLATSYAFMDEQSLGSVLTVGLSDRLKGLILRIVGGKNKATASSEVYDIVRDNTEPLTRLCKRLREDGVCTSVPSARKEVVECVQAYASEGVKVWRTKGVGRPAYVVSALPLEELERRGVQVAEEATVGDL